MKRYYTPKLPNTSPYSLAAIWMLIFTGCRASEIFTLQWKDVHLEDSYLYLQDSKVGVRAIPLNDKAKQILSSLPLKLDFPKNLLLGQAARVIKRGKNQHSTIRLKSLENNKFLGYGLRYLRDARVQKIFQERSASPNLGQSIKIIPTPDRLKKRRDQPQGHKLGTRERTA